MRYGLKIMVAVFVVIAAISAAAFTAYSFRPSAASLTALPAIASTAYGEITIDGQHVIQRFILYSDGKGSRSEIRTSFDKETGAQTQVEKSWYSADKGGFRQKDNAEESYYIGVSATSFPPVQGLWEKRSGNFSAYPPFIRGTIIPILALSSKAGGAQTSVQSLNVQREKMVRILG